MNIINPLTQKSEKIQAVLHSLAGQEGCDGEPYDQMVKAAEYIDHLEKNLSLIIFAIFDPNPIVQTITRGETYYDPEQENRR